MSENTKKPTQITDNYSPSYIQELCNNLGCNPAEVLITICNDVTRTSKTRIMAAKELNAMLRSPEKSVPVAMQGPYGMIQLPVVEAPYKHPNLSIAPTLRNNNAIDSEHPF